MRESGYYWVKFRGKMRVMYHTGEGGWLDPVLNACMFLDCELDWISNEQLNPPEVV